MTAEPLHDPTLRLPGPTSATALERMTEAEDTLRAIGAGQVDAFVLTDGQDVRRVFALSTADRPYRNFVETMRDGAATLSPTGTILYANGRLSELLACPRESIVGAPLARFVAGGLPGGLGALTGGVTGRDPVERDLLAGGGTTVPVLIGSSPLEMEGDDLICLTFSDLTAHRAQARAIAELSRAQGEQMVRLEEAQVALVEQATHDGLTHLPNRGLLVDRIELALSQAERSGRCCAVLFVDVDRFKQVNDTYGHAAGDVVLRRVADRLVGALRPMDTVARIGGDEFIVLAPDIDDRLHAVAVAERLVEAVCRRPERSADGKAVTVSVGISVSVGGRGPAEALLSEADTAMYQAKSRGGARAESFDEALGRQVQQRADAQEMLQSALDDRRVLAHYQPVVDLATGAVAGFEALARLADRDGTILPPAAFIPVAEESGLVLELGERMLGMACEEARGWPDGGSIVAVNLSARQFEPDDLPQIVRERLARTGLPPDRLHLELTETALMDLHPAILKQLGQLRDLGVEIGLDDFGTGYASLTHLRRLPVTFVKIDRSFVQGVGSDPEDDRIVSAVIDLAAHLGLRSIAEGVETRAHLDRLRELGCDQAQGFHLGRPSPAGDVETLRVHAQKTGTSL